ncbi:hypothetical protein [Guptibacillus hwajinpoensis]|uniref:hypothetical protein n=1 Tax=Guptibacillus hwajinpoensis TaxID=208199 RepID=UPI001CFCFA02|nr:hypothetical protein [Pseudalkalibacillus hwajinpoensis]WLR58960.1 hypothetical protein LC071_17640 [Pseudalkalibacillus hwajinpoensis]
MKKKPSFLLAIIPIVSMLLLLGFDYGMFHLRAEPLLITATIIAALIGNFLGVSWEEMQSGIVEKTAKAMPAILILITVGVLIGTLVKSGVTTVVGLLGTNDIARNTKSLLAEVKALNEEGMNAYMLTGGYGYPSNTLTGDVREDILFFQEILGLKLAIEDHRSSYVTKEELKRLASYTRVSSMLTGKKGFVHLHMGSGKNHYNQIYELLEVTDLPICLFSPTHVNRTPGLLEASVEFAKRGD